MTYSMMIAITVCVLSLVFGWYQRDLLQIEKYKNEALSTRIQVLQTQSDALKKSYEVARLQSSEDVRHSQEESRKILEIKVPKKCEEAIEWAIEQAQRLHPDG